MRIVISNPDGIGDVVLRLPLFEALREAGHELLLLCREPSRPLLERLGAGISVVGIRENPYQETPTGEAVFDAAPLDAALQFAADLLVFASYQWTAFEEQLAWALPDVPRIRMNGYRYAFWPKKASALPPPERERVVPVERQWHETLKNQALCRAILGRDVELQDPTMSVTQEDIERGRARLREVFGSESPPENFWIGCTGNAGDYAGNVRDWGRDNWAQVLRFMGSDLGIKVLLVGNVAERESLEAIRAEAASEGNIQVSAGEASDAEDLSRLLGLTWLARGYIGKDTGPMHIAAALQKPVIAVFGGGHWPQFTPAVTPSLAMTMGLPCIRCGWFCHLPQSLCVKQVPVGIVKDAVTAISMGKMRVREARLIAPSALLVEAARRRRGHEPATIQVRWDERKTMSEATTEGSLSTAGAMNGVDASLLAGLADLRGEIAEVKNQIAKSAARKAAAAPQSADQLLLEKAEVESETVQQLLQELKITAQTVIQQEREHSRQTSEQSDKRTQALTQELQAMARAAIERERDYARREKEWNDKLLRAATEAHAARFDASQLNDKLTAAERANREYAAQAVQIEGRLRRTGEIESRQRALDEKLHALESERNALQARIQELSFARSRRLLLKLHLVSRCEWETP